jgi:hypothetical protein
MAVLAGKLAARRKDCAPVAGKSTLNRLELSRETATRYHKVSHDPAAIAVTASNKLLVFLTRRDVEATNNNSERAATPSAAGRRESPSALAARRRDHMIDGGGAAQRLGGAPDAKIGEVAPVGRASPAPSPGGRRPRRLRGWPPAGRTRCARSRGLLSRAQVTLAISRLAWAWLRPASFWAMFACACAIWWSSSGAVISARTWPALT